MNKVLLIGRLTKAVEVKTSANGTPYAYFTVAVDRKFKDASGVRQTDFINCVAWRQTAQFVGQYFTKGQRIGVVGSITTRTVEDNTGKKYITEVTVDEAEFVESKNAAPTAAPTPAPARAPPYRPAQARNSGAVGAPATHHNRHGAPAHPGFDTPPPRA